MSYQEDKKFSDMIVMQSDFKKILIDSGLFLRYKLSTKKEDIENCIDLYINNIPVQYRNQLFKLKNIEYYPTIRYKREHNIHQCRVESEYFKIKNCIDNNKKYPIYLIWCLINKKTDTKLDVLKLIIVDIKEIYKKPLSHFKEIENYDKSSSFLVLKNIPYLMDYKKGRIKK